MAVYRHAELGYYEGPDTARAMLASGGWEKLSDGDANDYLAEKRAAELGEEEILASQVQLDPSVSGSDQGDTPSSAPDNDGGGNSEKENG
jgi:hypothetical protein